MCDFLEFMLEKCDSCRKNNVISQSGEKKSHFIPGLNLVSLCFKLIVIHYHTPKQREIKFKPGIKLNLTTYIHVSIIIIR